METSIHPEPEAGCSSRPAAGVSIKGLNTLEKVHQAAERASPHDPTLATFRTSAGSIRATEFAMALAMRKPPVLTFCLLGLNLLLLVISELLERFGGVRGLSPLDFLGANSHPRITQGQYFRLLSACFLHIGWFHLLVNSFGLWFFGRVCEPLFGRLRFLIVYLTSGLAGNLVSHLLQDAGSVGSAGASGAIFGLLGATVVFPRRAGKVLPSKEIKRFFGMFTTWLIINIAYTIRNPLFDIDQGGHFGGLAAGALLALVLGSPSINPWKLHRRLILVPAGALGGLVGWMTFEWLRWMLGFFS